MEFSCYIFHSWCSILSRICNNELTYSKFTKFFRGVNYSIQAQSNCCKHYMFYTHLFNSLNILTYFLSGSSYGNLCDWCCCRPVSLLLLWSFPYDTWGVVTAKILICSGLLFSLTACSFNDFIALSMKSRGPLTGPANHQHI